MWRAIYKNDLGELIETEFSAKNENIAMIKARVIGLKNNLKLQSVTESEEAFGCYAEDDLSNEEELDLLSSVLQVGRSRDVIGYYAALAEEGGY